MPLRTGLPRPCDPRDLDVSTLSAAQAVAAPTNATGTLRAVPSTLPSEARATVISSH